MHILYPIGSYYPAQCGGPNNSIYWMAKALTKAGMQITVVTTSAGQPASTPLNTWLDTDGGRVQYVQTTFHNAPFRMLLTAVRALQQADVVHLTSFFYPPSLVLATVAICLGKRIVWSPRGEVDPAALVYRPRLKQFILKSLKRFRHHLAFHSTCPAETRYLADQFGADIAIVELPNFMLLPTQLPHFPTQRYFLYLGRIHPKKALDRLIGAFDQSAQCQTTGVRLLIAGDAQSSYGNDLRQQVSRLGLGNRVEFTGMVTGEAKQQMLANAYALVLPSHTENFGNVVIEALAQSTPVIASTGTPWKILDLEQAGFWVSNDEQSLCHALDQCLSLPPGMYTTYRQRAALLAQHQFDVYANCYRWIDAYRSLTSASSPGTLCVA